MMFSHPSFHLQVVHCLSELFKFGSQCQNFGFFSSNSVAKSNQANTSILLN